MRQTMKQATLVRICWINVVAHTHDEKSSSGGNTLSNQSNSASASSRSLKRISRSSRRQWDVTSRAIFPIFRPAAVSSPHRPVARLLPPNWRGPDADFIGQAAQLTDGDGRLRYDAEHRVGRTFL